MLDILRQYNIKIKLLVLLKTLSCICTVYIYFLSESAPHSEQTTQMGCHAQASMPRGNISPQSRNARSQRSGLRKHLRKPLRKHLREPATQASPQDATQRKYSEPRYAGRAQISNREYISRNPLIIPKDICK